MSLLPGMLEWQPYLSPGISILPTLPSNDPTEMDYVSVGLALS
jgi:hypothetical protein